MAKKPKVTVLNGRAIAMTAEAIAEMSKGGQVAEDAAKGLVLDGQRFTSPQRNIQRFHPRRK